MKKIIIIIVTGAIITACSSFEKKETDDKHPETVKLEEHDKDHLYYYSKGIHTKNLALEASDQDERNKLIEEAIKLFIKAREFNKQPGPVYNQISECYLIKNDMENSLLYAEKSIEEDETDVEPYTRIYSIYAKKQKNHEAADILKRYLAIDPDEIYIHFLLGEHYMRTIEDLENARNSFEKVIELGEKNAMENHYKEYAYYYLGYIAFRMNNPERAAASFEKVVEINPNNVNAIYTLALIYIDINNIEKAGRYARRYLSIDSDNEKIHSVLGRVLYIQNDRAASDHLKKAFKGDMFDSLFSRALYYEMIRKDKEAGQIVPSLLQLNHNLVSPRIVIARIAMRNEQYETAYDEFFNAGLILFNSEQYVQSGYYLHKALEIKKGSEALFYLARVYEEMHNPALAVHYYKELNEIDPDSGIMLQIGLLYSFNKKHDEALNYIDRVIEKEPENARAYFSKAIVKIQQDNNTHAEELLEKSISIDEDIDIYYFYLAVVYERTDRPEKAMVSLKKALEVNPHSAMTLNFLGYLYADENIKLDEAYELINKALEFEPDNGAYVDSLGWVYYKKGNYHAALEHLLRAEKLLEKEERMDPVVYDHIGDTYLKLGNKTKAIQYWEKSLEHEDNEEIKEKINEHK